MKTAPARLLLFARLPRIGEVKTRLIPALGEAGAFVLHQALLKHTLDWVKQQTLCQAELWFDRPPPESSIEKTGLPCRVQRGEGLGERMHQAASQAFAEGAARVVIIGSDCPALNISYLKQALMQLEAGHDLVLGAAEDGGYVLIAQRDQSHACLFEDISWGSEKVLTETCEQARQAALKVHCLPPLHDIDRPEDLRHLPSAFHGLLPGDLFSVSVAEDGPSIDPRVFE